MKRERCSWLRPSRFLGVMCLTGCFLAVFCLHAQEPVKKSADMEPREDKFPVKMEVAATKLDSEGKQQIVVTLAIQHGYFVFANPPGNENLEGAEITMKVKGEVPLEARVTYPEGEVVKDEVVGDYRIYKGKVNIRADVRRPNSGPIPLQVTVRVRPLDHAGCRWPTRLLKAMIP